MVAELPETLAIVGDALTQAGAEHLLHVGKALVAHGLAEADQRRRLDLRLGGDRRDRAEGDLVRIIQREPAIWARRLGRAAARCTIRA